MTRIVQGYMLKEDMEEALVARRTDIFGHLKLHPSSCPILGRMHLYAIRIPKNVSNNDWKEERVW